MQNQTMEVRRTRPALAAAAVGLLLAGTVAALPRPATAAPALTGATGSPDGFAAVPAWGQDGTTGGAGGATVTVRTAEDFLAAIAQPEPLIVQVDGILTLPGPMHNVASDKTIVGLGAGGGLNIGLPIDDSITDPPADAVHNVIIQNLKFDAWADDAINVQMFTHHVWIDHNTFVAGFDGAADVKRGSSYVTVSWNHSTHGKNMLVGHFAGNAHQDKGRLKVTYHHNFFDGTVERNPWVRFGNPAHVYNNYYRAVSKYGVRSSSEAGILVEGNFFQGVAQPFQRGVGGTELGDLVERDNCFAESGEPQSGGTTEEIPYPYTVEPCDGVPAAVTAGAGAGRLG
ncbi:hypothetical protein Ari01nite_04140 [Paractinoplanes rishiriensis]|uniref:Pectate lyase domain-containing protein n=2 Tax=Paractinoplanes rishiriensis TaxID=1050105 RepID=A0A919MS77_9ACTN|nr:hypothetical protein Ari01nite_04140 [Actinoplanes rishiriensis]